MVAKQNLIVYQGADYQRALTLKDESETLMDLTGYVFRGQARLRYEDTNPAFTFTFTLRDQVAYTGMVDMLIPASETSDYAINKQTKFKYDIEMVNASGIVRRIIEGEIQLNPEVTR